MKWTSCHSKNKNASLENGRLCRLAAPQLLELPVFSCTVLYPVAGYNRGGTHTSLIPRRADVDDVRVLHVLKSATMLLYFK